MKVIIFGAGKFASLAWYCVTHDSSDEVVGFTVDAPFLTEPFLHGLPVVDFATVESHFHPDSHVMLVHVGAPWGSHLRTDKYLAAKSKGYSFATYISSRAMCWPDLKIGENSVIYEGAIVQPFASVGANVIIRSQVHVSHHVEIGDHSFIAAGACLGGCVTVGKRCFVGLNATVRDGIRIAEGCFIAAGAVLTKDTQPDGLYAGVPARRTGVQSA
jgi:sugar O-acyltransferase (sialic acid O-acetyltransferase NeuD family)